MLIIDQGRHPGTRHFARLFGYAHLPDGPVRQVAADFSGLAQYLVNRFPDGPELTVALRKLLESKDAAVRCAVLQFPPTFGEPGA